MSELNDRFEALANRGTPRGVDDVLNAAMQEVRQAEQREGNGDGVVDSYGDLAVLEPDPVDDVQVVQMDEARSRKSRRPWRTAVAAGGLAAMLGVVTMGVASLLADGGANSAEDAVRQLADAVEHEDPLAAVDVLNPDEIRSLRSTVDTISRRAQELELVNDAAAPLAGVDLSVKDLGLTSEELAPGYIKVSVTSGRVDAQLNSDAIADRLRRRIDDPNTALSGVAREDLIVDGIDPFVVAVERDGGWYVSPAYTVFEYIRLVNGLPAAEYGSGLTSAPGADSPEAAAADALRAYSAGDWNRLWELAPPNELPLYDYRAALTQAMGDDEAPNFSIDAFEASTEINGDAATITVRANGVMEEGGNWSIDDRCLSIDQVDYYEDTPETYTNNFCPSSAQNPMFGVTSLFLGYGEERAAEDGYMRFTAVKHNDRWFLSPVGSALAMLDHVIANASDESIYAMFGMYDAMEVDGSIALGTEVRGTTDRSYEPRIYTFEGQQGQSVIGTFQAFEDTEYGGYADTYLYGPDGTQIYDAYGLLQNQTLELPADGTYRLVVLPTQRGEFAFTLYDAVNAPEDVLNPPHECTTDTPPDYCAEMVAEGCTFGPNNSATCPDSSYSSGGEVCTVLPDGSEKCGGEETCTVLPDGSEECTISSGAELTPTTAVEGASGDEGSAFAPAPAPDTAPTSVP